MSVALASLNRLYRNRIKIFCSRSELIHIAVPPVILSQGVIFCVRLRNKKPQSQTQKIQWKSWSYHKDHFNVQPSNNSEINSGDIKVTQDSIKKVNFLIPPIYCHKYHLKHLQGSHRGTPVQGTALTLNCSTLSKYIH